jgi:glycosyltransferase involved in cell wall biosynthesis
MMSPKPGMVIGIDAEAFYRNAAGTGTFVRNVIHVFLRTKRDEANFVLFSPSPKAKPADKTRDILVTRLIHGISDISRMHILLPLESRKKGVQVLFCPSYLSPLLPPCPVVAVLYDMSFKRYPRTMDRLYLHYLAALLPLTARRASLLIAISEFAKREIHEHLHIPPDKIRVVPLAAAEHFQVIKDEGKTAAFRAKYNLSRPFLLFVGTLEPRKNIPALLRAFSLLKKDGVGDHQLVLCGPQGRSCGDIFRGIRELGLEKEVLYLGYLPEAELPLLYNAARMLVFPSLYEGFGLPVLEAMACGCPVVTSSTSALPETAGGAALFVDPQDPTALARAAADLALDGNLRLEMVRRGLERARMFSWERTAAGIFNVLREAAQGARR